VFRNKFSFVTAVVGLILIITCLHASSVCAQGTMHNPNSMWIDPEAISFNEYNAAVGTRFNVTAWVNVDNASFNWEVTMLFNTTLLQATRAGLTAGSTSQFYAGHSTFSPGAVIDNATGSVLIGETLLADDSGAPGNGSLAWFEFEIIAAPNSTVTSLTCALDISDTDNNFILWADGATPIPTTNYGATYTFSYITDTTPPTIADPTQVPAIDSVVDGQAVTVSVNVTDNVGGSGVANVILSYSTDNSTFTNVTMTLNAQTGLWDSVIPGKVAGTTVYYNIIAYDSAGNYAVNSNVGNWNYTVIIPEFTSSVLMIVMLAAVTSAVLLMRKKIIR
jgi:hypothetical protein